MAHHASTPQSVLSVQGWLPTTAVLIILALDLAMLAYLWHRAIVEAHSVTALAQAGRIGTLEGLLDEATFTYRRQKREIEDVTRQKEEAIEQMRGLNRRIVHLDQSRDDACIEASKLRAKLAFEQQETARLTSLVECADDQITRSTRAVESLNDFFTVALMELEATS